VNNVDVDVDEHVVEARFTVTSNASELASLRRSVASFLDSAGADETVIPDFQLAVSELATNVIQHSALRDVSVLIRRSAVGWSLEIEGVDDLELHAVTEPTLPPIEARSGRGLVIVRSVMDSVDIVEENGSRFIRCVKRIE
jgi:serine/threonine-protein kinase RsbW